MVHRVSERIHIQWWRTVRLRLVVAVNVTKSAIFHSV